MVFVFSIWRMEGTMQYNSIHVHTLYVYSRCTRTDNPPVRMPPACILTIRTIRTPYMYMYIFIPWPLWHMLCYGEGYFGWGVTRAHLHQYLNKTAKIMLTYLRVELITPQQSIFRFDSNACVYNMLQHDSKYRIQFKIWHEFFFFFFKYL